ncbi:MAG TPA: hypothetical protein DDW85_10280 [Porphyromonadaceae bacterium]|nr:hypothetical protein [Porphyromonadaceae bacterium]
MNIIKRYSIHRFSFRISLFFGLLFFASCTYDYFEDETNYVVYAPKASSELMTDDYRIEDIHIYVYKETLQKQKTASYPFQENTRMKFGNFNFRLFPGSYLTYCFANTADIHFYDMETYQDAAFGLQESESNEYRYPDSLALFSTELKPPVIDYPAPLKTDTAYFNKRYSGRICVAFEKLTKLNPFLTYSNISEVKIEATGTGTYQRLSLLTDSVNTRSSRYSSSDKVKVRSNLYEKPYGDYDFGIDGYFFPSINEEESGSTIPISLTLDFLDRNGVSIHAFSISVTETLHMNQTIYLGTDGLSTLVLDIGGPEQWDPEIVPGDDGGMGI